MGYSISQEQWEKLQRYEREGRRCAFSTTGGGCFNRATTGVTQESWTYKVGEGDSREHEMTLCTRHAEDVGYQGVNFRVTATRKLA